MNNLILHPAKLKAMKQIAQHYRFQNNNLNHYCMPPIFLPKRHPRSLLSPQPAKHNRRSLGSLFCTLRRGIHSASSRPSLSTSP